MSRFKVGDRVEVIRDFAGLNLQGKQGTVVDIQPVIASYDVGVEFDEGFFEEHGCNGKAEKGHGRYGLDSELKLLETKKSLMKKVSNMMKKLLDSDTQTLVKAGFINGDLELTTEGNKALNEILFTTNKAELVKNAQAIIDEENSKK